MPTLNEGKNTWIKDREKEFQERKVGRGEEGVQKPETSG